MKIIKEYWAIILFVVTAIGWAIDKYVLTSVETVKIKTLTFDDVPQKNSVIYHVKGAPTPEQLQRDRIMDSINKATAIEFRRNTTKMLKKKDSIDMLNAVQMYQIKELLKKQGVTLDSINE